MAKKGRKALSTPTIEWKCRIPVDIAAKVDMFQFDPVRGQPEYGARSALVTQLLRDWLASHQQQPALDGLTTEQHNPNTTHEKE